MTRLNTPGGMPEPAMIFDSACAVPGTRSAGLNTTQLPYASAGAIFHAGMAIGKFHGVIRPDDAERLARDLDVDVRPHGCDLLAGKPHAFGREEQEDLAGANRFTHAFGDGLAFLAREQAAELVLAREDLVADALQDVVALLDRPARPRRKRLLRRGDRAFRRFRVGPSEETDHVAGVRRVDVLGGLRRFEPFARDVVARCFHCRSFEFC